FSPIYIKIKTKLTEHQKNNPNNNTTPGTLAHHPDIAIPDMTKIRHGMSGTAHHLLVYFIQN
ncbi:hypothetical protein ACVGWJ_00135, partial [Enterobacter hormaechei]